jgi:outer membrane protein OmpA-like peptidoglycan-associated protein
MRIAPFIAMFFLGLILSLATKAQVVKWASQVEFEYNAFEAEGIAFKGGMALGPPDAYPYGSLSPRAFRMKSESAYGRLVVSFDEPIEATQIWILENYLPGRVTKVILFDTNNDKYAAYDGKPQVLDVPYRNFIIDLGQRTSYKIQKIEINLISIQAPGWAQIDAVGISDTSPQLVAEELNQLNAKAEDPNAIASPLQVVEKMNAEDVDSRLQELEKARLEEQQRKEEEEEKARLAEEQRKKEEEELKAKEEQQRQQEEAERKRLEEEERQRLEALRKREEELKKAEEEASKIAAEEEQKRLEEERKKAEEARRKAEEEDLKRKQEEEARMKAEEEARRKAEEDARARAEEAARKKAEEDRKAEAERLQREAEIRQLREIQRINEQKRAEDQVRLPPLPPELAVLNSRTEVSTERLTPAKIELITTRRQLDVKSLSITPASTGSYIQSAKVMIQGQSPDIPDNFRRQSVGDGINTPYAEIKPIVSADGQTLFFSRQNYPENIAGEKDIQDIYFAELSNGGWGMAENIGPPLNNVESNGVVAISGDGNTVLLINEYGPVGKRSKKGSGVSMSNLTSSGWSDPVNLKIENHYNDSDYVDYFLSNDRRVMILAVERRDTEGDQDLYVSFNQDENQWTEPINMGRTINSTDADFSPFLAPDNRTLYFASYGHDTRGGPDIFMSKRLDRSWTSWSEPVNIGPSINSEGYEAYFTLPASGEYAYLVTDQGGIENSRDIYIVAIPPEFMPDPVLTITGRILDANTLQPLEGKIAVESILDGYESAAVNSNQESGEFQFILPSKDQYQVRAIAPGYLPANEVLDLMNFSTSETVEKTFYMLPLNQDRIQNTDIATSGIINQNEGAEKAPPVSAVITEKREVFLISNWLVRDKSGNSLQSELEIVAENDSTIRYIRQVGEEGQISLELPYGQNYNYYSRVKGYYNQSGTLEYRSAGEDLTIFTQINHEEIVKGVTEALPNVMFQQGEAILLEVSFAELDRLTSFLAEHPTVKIKLDGHTDAIGDPALNLELSRRRVETVKSYLVEKGIDAERIETEAFGGTKPIASNASERTRRLNRRVEWTIIEN